MYLAEFFLEPETIEDLYLVNLFLEIEDSIPRSNMPSNEMLVKEDGKSTDEFSAHNILCQFSFNPGGIVVVYENVMNLCIWDPGITFKFKALIGTVNTKPPLLLGSNGTFGFIAYANSMNLIWGDKIDCHPTFSWYEFIALQTCKNDQWSLIVFENVLDLVKATSIVVAYVVHKVMLNESKITFILVNCGKLTTITNLMCYPTHFGGNRRVEEHTIAQQLLESNLVLKALHNAINTIPIKFLSHHGIFGYIHLAEYGQTYGGITNANNSVYMKKDMKIVEFSMKEQMSICRIVASVMIIGNM
ncbi:hypothetical protein H5410_002064 [Solanum commersonii]|uniref:Uncharacterized protein n=1 Tax=Solanum commersonii TaxID=4109 RepID=A0A9J6B1B2_SOLCO|nr:hypothetical protein H5410_002064 [Solanum commersonii]